MYCSLKPLNPVTRLKSNPAEISNVMVSFEFQCILLSPCLIPLQDISSILAKETEDCYAYIVLLVTNGKASKRKYFLIMSEKIPV